MHVNINTQGGNRRARVGGLIETDLGTDVITGLEFSVL